MILKAVDDKSESVVGVGCSQQKELLVPCQNILLSSLFQVCFCL